MGCFALRLHYAYTLRDGYIYDKISKMAFIRKFKTGSDATGVQVCYKEQGRVVKTVHVGSARTDAGIEKLVKKAQAIIDKDKTPLFNLDKFNK